jgi:hypothetical protein
LIAIIAAMTPSWSSPGVGRAARLGLVVYAGCVLGSLGCGGGAGTGSSHPGGGGATSAGSSSGGGGAAGAGAGTVVEPCPNLPAPGSWENISPPAFSSPANMETLSVVVDPSDQSVYAAAGNKTNGGNGGTGVYRSKDCGATFELVSTGMNGDKLATGDPWGDARRFRPPGDALHQQRLR